MNKVIMIGRTTKAVELKQTKTGKSVAEFSIAVRRSFNTNGEQDSDFFNCVAYSATAELISKYVKKGDQVGIEGRLQTRNYTNSEGRKIYITEIIVDNVEFLQGKREQSSSTDAKVEADPFSSPVFEEVNPDDPLPF